MILYGASGHGKVIIDTLEANGIKLDYVVDDNASICSLLGYEVRRDCGHYDSAIVSIGNGRIRKEIVSRLNVNEWVRAIHPKATVSSHASIDEGTVVMAGAVINSGAVIGKHCIINTGATVDHDCVIGDFVHIAPGVHVSGGVNVGEGSWVGVGACVKQGVHIGEWVTIGAGSVVVKDIPDGVTAYGCPCRVCSDSNKNMNLDYTSAVGGGKIRILINSRAMSYLFCSRRNSVRKERHSHFGCRRFQKRSRQHNQEIYRFSSDLVHHWYFNDSAEEQRTKTKDSVLRK